MPQNAVVVPTEQRISFVPAVMSTVFGILANIGARRFACEREDSVPLPTPDGEMV
jgi:hypothetical protein